MSEPALDVVDLAVGFRPLRLRPGGGGDPHWALDGVSFAVNPGELVAVVGRNGSGKTTLLQAIAGVVRPDRGGVRAAGRVSSLVELSVGIHRELTGRENLLVAGVLLGMRRREVRSKMPEITAFTGLDERTLDAPLRTYSAGMGLRLAFSVVVHTDPAVLAVDEVLAVGDDSFHTACLERIDGLRAAGSAVILVTHDLPLARRFADRALLLDGGRLLADGDPDEVVDRYLHITGGRPDEQDVSERAVWRATRVARNAGRTD